MMANVLTVDVEDWFQTNSLNLPVDTWDRYEDRIEGSMTKLLDLLDEYGAKATIFVLGCVAAKHPALIRKMTARGHEVGSHGGWHRMVNRMSLQEFRADVRACKQLLEDLTGNAVRCYRAPSWSISRDCYGTLPILEEEGFICDSSLQPFRTPLSGNPDVPLHAFRPVVDGRRLGLVEVPPTVWNAGALKVPFLGGFYLRFWPSWFSTWALKRVNRRRSGLVYVHPWEFDEAMPRLKLPPHIFMAQYYNLRTMEAKFRALLAGFAFMPLGTFVEEHSFPDHPLDSSGGKPALWKVKT
ncbi:polysaccharide deacetylase family protein [Paenibacillus darwinianus]|nr:polysaccharide deacetylase family protein [Paenibacillus darwinianus]